jgi:predicted ATPase
VVASAGDVLNSPNFFVISGGPRSGKTTVLRELAKLGIPYAPEVARQIIKEQVEAGGTALPWSDRASYANLMLERSIEAYLEHASASMPIFADRGIPDTLGYARLIGLKNTCAIETACWRYRYASFVFLAPPWKEIYETDDERIQDFYEAERTFQVLAGVYRECDHDLVELPKLAPRDRARFILSELHRRSENAETGRQISQRRLSC